MKILIDEKTLRHGIGRVLKFIISLAARLWLKY
jgi:hypothetical protein